MANSEARSLSAGVVSAVFLALAVMASAFILAPVADAGTEDYDGVIDLYGFRITMGLQDPNQVESVEWDFGDGTENVTVAISTENTDGHVTHTYAAEGDYVVKATMRNSYNGGSETVLTYLYHIHGFPELSFDSRGGSPVASIEGTSSQFVAEKPADPARDGYDFTGWYLDEGCTELFDWTSTVIRDLTLYAGWSERVVQHTVSFDLNGGEGSVPQQTIVHGEAAVQPADPSRSGFVFTGWKWNGALWSFTDAVTADMVLVADWQEVGAVFFTVTFDAAGGTAGQTSLNIREGNSLILPGASRDGYDFDGWYKDGGRIGGTGDSYRVVSDVTLTAHWTETADDSDEDDGILWIVPLVVAALCIIGFAVVRNPFLLVPAIFCIIAAALMISGVI